MLLSSILPALLLSLSLCKGTSAIETPPLEQGVELPGGDKTCPDTWFVPRGPNGDCECGYSFDGVVSCDEGTENSASRFILPVIRQLLESVSLTV